MSKAKQCSQADIPAFLLTTRREREKKISVLFSFTVAQILRNCTDFSWLFWIYGRLKEIRIWSHMNEEQNIHIHSKYIFLSYVHKTSMLSLAVTDHVLLV